MTNQAAETPRKPVPRWVGNAALLLIFGALSCVSGEIGVRLLYADSVVLFPRYHTGAWYGDYHLRRLRPKSRFLHTSPDGQWEFRTNGQGFRDAREYTHEKRPGLFRVLVLGDSHTEGFECRQDHTYSQVLEGALKRSGLDAEAMNAGISGFSTAEELAFLEAEGLEYRPDAVVLGFFGNDFEDNLKAGLFAVDGDRLVVESREHVPGVRVLDTLNAFPPLRWASEHSFLYSVFMNTAWERAKALLLSDARSGLQTEFAIPTEAVSNYGEVLTIKLLQRMYELCKEKGILFVLVDLPTVDPERVFRSSIPANLVDQVRAASDVFVSSEELLGPHRGISEIHVPRGQQHISEFTHSMIGEKVGEEILRARSTATPAR